MDFQTAALALAWLAIVLLALAMSGMLRQMQSLKGESRTGPPLGHDLLGRTIEFPVGRRGLSNIALFMSTDCPTCGTLARALPGLHREAPTGVAISVLFQDSGNGLSDSPFPVYENQRDRFDQLGVSVTPFAIAVSPEGVVTKAEPIGSEQGLQQFIAQVREEEVRG